jgi:hypothetical protein
VIDAASLVGSTAGAIGAVGVGWTASPNRWRSRGRAAEGSLDGGCTDDGTLDEERRLSRFGRLAGRETGERLGGTIGGFRVVW